jgi:hypothetical protein
MINSALERQAKSTDELLLRLIEEQNGEKLDTTIIISSTTSCIVTFTQTNPETRGTSVDGATIPNPSTQPMNHFYS